MQLNKKGKSAAISNQTRVHEMPHVESWYPVLTEDAEFELLGASLSANPVSFYENQFRKQAAFFDLLIGLHVHPVYCIVLHWYIPCCICVVIPGSDTYVASCHRSMYV